MNHFNFNLKPNAFIDTVLVELGLKNDAAMARYFETNPGSICRARNGNRISDEFILMVHIEDPERFPIARLKALRGQRPYEPYQTLRTLAVTPAANQPEAIAA